MQIKSMTIKSMDEAGKGLAELATLSAVDNDGDTYDRGAFAWKAGGHQWAMMVPAHNRRAIPFGKARVFEDGDKAYAELNLNLKTSDGRDWHEALLFDLATGDPVQEWSYGYNIVDMDYRVSGNSRVRVLKKLDVDEVSPVLRGAGVGTRTIAIKGAKLRDEHFAGLIIGLGELATAIDNDPTMVAAAGLKQLGDIRDAIDRVLAGGDDGVHSDEVKNALARDTAFAHVMQFERTRRRFGI